MKKFKIIISLALILGSSAICYSQKIKESTESIGDLTGNALSITIVRADKKEIIKEWKSIMKSYDGSVKTKGDNIYTSDARIESISSGNVQINAEINKEKGNNHLFTVIFKSEKGAVSSKDDISGYTAASFIVSKFAKDLSVKAATAYKESQQKKFMSLQKDKKTLEKENIRLTEKIEDYNKKIIEAKETIERNKKALLRKKEELEKQEKVVLESDQELKSIK